MGRSTHDEGRNKEKDNERLKGWEKREGRRVQTRKRRYRRGRGGTDSRGKPGLQVEEEGVRGGESVVAGRSRERGGRT